MLSLTAAGPRDVPLLGLAAGTDVASVVLVLFGSVFSTSTPRKGVDAAKDGTT